MNTNEAKSLKKLFETIYEDALETQKLQENEEPDINYWDTQEVDEILEKLKAGELTNDEAFEALVAEGIDEIEADEYIFFWEEDENENSNYREDDEGFFDEEASFAAEYKSFDDE